MRFVIEVDDAKVLEVARFYVPGLPLEILETKKADLEERISSKLESGGLAKGSEAGLGLYLAASVLFKSMNSPEANSWIAEHMLDAIKRSN